MPRRKTVIGRGAFGRPVPEDQHALEVLRRILSKGLPLTEDAIFLCMLNILRQKRSLVLQKVRASRAFNSYRYFHFSPDIDLLEVRQDGTVVGYELKGYRGTPQNTISPPCYAGIDEALSYLVNPLQSPQSQSFAGSIFDYVYVVHPSGTGIEKLADLLLRFTPLGLAVVDTRGSKELVKPKPNPYLNIDLKAFFIDHLDAFQAYTEYKVNPIQ